MKLAWWAWGLIVAAVGVVVWFVVSFFNNQAQFAGNGESTSQGGGVSISLPGLFGSISVD